VKFPHYSKSSQVKSILDDLYFTKVTQASSLWRLRGSRAVKSGAVP